MNIEIPNALGFECLKLVPEGTSVEEAVNMLLEKALADAEEDV